MGEPNGTIATTTPCLSASCWFVRLVCVPRPLASDSLSYSLMRSGAALSRKRSPFEMVSWCASKPYCKKRSPFEIYARVVCLTKKPA